MEIPKNQSPEIILPEDKPEFIMEDYKTELEVIVGTETLHFDSWFNEKMIYSYQYSDEDMKDNETYYAKIDGDWYLCEKTLLFIGRSRLQRISTMMRSISNKRISIWIPTATVP